MSVHRRRCRAFRAGGQRGAAKPLPGDSSAAEGGSPVAEGGGSLEGPEFCGAGWGTGGCVNGRPGNGLLCEGAPSALGEDGGQVGPRGDAGRRRGRDVLRDGRRQPGAQRVPGRWGEVVVPAEVGPRRQGQGVGQPGEFGARRPAGQSGRDLEERVRGLGRPLPEDDGAGQHVADPFAAGVQHRGEEADAARRDEEVDEDAAQGADERLPEPHRPAVVADDPQPQCVLPDASCRGSASPSRWCNRRTSAPGRRRPVRRSATRWPRHR